MAVEPFARQHHIKLVPSKPTTLESISSRSIENDHLTDVGNAERLVQCHGINLRYCHPWGAWIIRDGQRWVKDASGTVIKRAKETIQSMHLEASDTKLRSLRGDLASHAIQSESLSRIRAMVSLAESELPVLPEALDRDPWLLNVENGTLDLRTAVLESHERTRLISKLARVVYDPKAICPLWAAFLEQILPDLEVRAFLQRAVGSSLTGIAQDKAMFVLWGSGDNGKSVLIETIRDLLGDYAINTPVETFLAKSSSGIPNDIARLRGARFISAQESDEGRRLNESLVKAMTGGDTLTGRFLHAEFFDFRPEFKPFLSTNHKPVVRGTDNGIWNRIKLIPFTVTIPKDQQDRNLRAKLKEELSGILNWAIHGCREWRRLGLNEPQVLHEATASYRQEMDHLKDFLRESCNDSAESKSLLKGLYEAYRRWCEAAGEESMKKKAFASQLRERGYGVGKGTGNQTYVSGLALNPVT